MCILKGGVPFHADTGSWGNVERVLNAINIIYTRTSQQTEILTKIYTFQKGTNNIIDILCNKNKRGLVTIREKRSIDFEGKKKKDIEVQNKSYVPTGAEQNSSHKYSYLPRRKWFCACRLLDCTTLTKLVLGNTRNGLPLQSSYITKTVSAILVTCDMWNTGMHTHTSTHGTQVCTHTHTRTEHRYANTHTHARAHTHTQHTRTHTHTPPISLLSPW